MIVNVVDYGDIDDKKFITYEVLGLDRKKADFLHRKLSEETYLDDNNILRIIMYFEEKFYPFQSEVAKVKMDDFIAREEIEMNIFLASFLEDM